MYAETSEKDVETRVRESLERRRAQVGTPLGRRPGPQQRTRGGSPADCERAGVAEPIRVASLREIAHERLGGRAERRQSGHAAAPVQ